MSTQSQTGSIGTPSQAEGDLETAEEALGERKSSTNDAQSPGPQTPSQAEGDLETVEEDLQRDA